MQKRIRYSQANHLLNNVIKAFINCILLQKNVNIALDLEQIRDRPLKANGGLELRYIPSFLKSENSIGISNLAVRGGIEDCYLEDRGTGIDFQEQLNFTYGFGLGLKIQGITLNVDYSFGSLRIGNYNRFTMSLLL